MADFLTQLWESVFTPGTTPTLLIATNASFAALQVLLAALLFATSSIHFAILSVLCGGLWYSINWFARELKEAQAKEIAADRLRRKRRADEDRSNRNAIGDSADDEGNDTEVERAMKDSTISLSSAASAPLDCSEGTNEVVRGDSQATGSRHSATSGVMRQRHYEDSEKGGEISTDSEWEKIDE